MRRMNIKLVITTTRIEVMRIVKVRAHVRTIGDKKVYVRSHYRRF